MEPRDVFCQKCQALPGHPCRAASGQLTGTHTVRVEHARYNVEQLALAVQPRQQAGAA